MNKEKAIKEIKKASEIFYACDYIKTKVAESIISKINEPQKVTVPKFVGEWIEWCKTNEATLLGAISPIDEFGSAICNDKRVESMAASRWAQRNQDTFARAWLDGYEIEQEKLYTVEIPNPNIIGNEVYVLMKNGFNQVVMVKKFGVDWKKERGFQLTEAEIRKHLEWAWPFAVPVEEK